MTRLPYHLLSSLLLLTVRFDKSYERAICNRTASEQGAKGRVFAGVETRQGDMPFVFKFPTTKNISFDAPGCTAFLIHKKWALTSAHCVKMDGAFVVLTNTPPEPPPIIPRQIRFWYFPPGNENGTVKEADIALLQLSGTTDIEPVKLPNTYTDPVIFTWPVRTYDGLLLTIAGYGYDNTNYIQSKTLKKTYVYLEDWCPDSIPADKEDFYWCTRTGPAGESACGGDSGAPVLVETADSKVAIAVHGAGYSSCQHGHEPFQYPQLNIKIAAYFKWINETLCSWNDKLPYYTYDCPAT